MFEEDRQIAEELIHFAVPRVFRDRTNTLDMFDDYMFRMRFRLSHRGFEYVIRALAHDLAPNTTRSLSLSSAQKLAVFLETIGSASMQRVSGTTLGCSQCTASRVVSQVSEILYNRRNEFIRWPSEGNHREMSLRFYNRCGIPNIVGALDGTHIKIVAPTEQEEAYVNRKCYHSINVGTIADLDRRFIWVSAKYPGRAHDSRESFNQHIITTQQEIAEAQNELDTTLRLLPEFFNKLREIQNNKQLTYSQANEQITNTMNSLDSRQLRAAQFLIQLYEPGAVPREQIEQEFEQAGPAQLYGQWTGTNGNLANGGWSQFMTNERRGEAVQERSISSPGEQLTADTNVAIPLGSLLEILEERDKKNTTRRV